MLPSVFPYVFFKIRYRKWYTNEPPYTPVRKAYPLRDRKRLIKNKFFLQYRRKKSRNRFFKTDFQGTSLVIFKCE